MELPEPSLEDIEAKMRSYLAGEIDVDDFDEWVDLTNMGPAIARATEKQIGPNSFQIIAYANRADALLMELSGLFCEMTCSGCYLKEPEFRERVQELLNGAPSDMPIQEAKTV